MKIVVLGAGQVGSTVAHSLSSEENDVTIVDLDSRRLKELQNRLDIRCVLGFASHPKVLVRAGIEDADLVISLGGDGTLLTAARALADKNTPLLGINLGRLGFLADVSFENFEAYIDEVMAGRYSVEKRFFIEGKFYQGNELVATNIALNDIILHSPESANMIQYEISSGGDLIHIQRSDGVIVTTPTGSTAYALSGGGPIMHPSLNTLAIVPICPHTLSNRPIVLPADQPIEVRLGQDTQLAKVSFDGHSTQLVNQDSRVLITRYREPLALLHPEDYDYFEVLREKLDWSANY